MPKNAVHDESFRHFYSIEVASWLDFCKLLIFLIKFDNKIRHATKFFWVACKIKAISYVNRVFKEYTCEKLSVLKISLRLTIEYSCQDARAKASASLMFGECIYLLKLSGNSML